MKIAIVGASGHVGSCAAFNIAVHELADELVMIGGRREGVLQQYVTDLSAAVSGQDILVRAGRDEDMYRSDII